MAKKKISKSAEAAKAGTRLGKGKRVPSGPVGTPNGLHDVKNPGCRCGRCGARG